MCDVVVLTESRYVDIQPGPDDWYANNVLTEDRLVVTALEKQGLKVARLDWADSEFDWSQTQAILFRTTWDYFDRFAEFQRWLEKVQALTRLINPADLIAWNIDKHYLRDLQQLGVNVPLSHFIERGETNSLQSLFAQHDLTNAVLKPCVGGAGRHTYKLSVDNLREFEPNFRELIESEAFLLQPFLKHVPEKGEVAYIVIDGKVTHAILKKAKPGDFRVQDDFGGTIHPYQPSKAELKFAEEVVSKVVPQPTYARVDVVWDNDQNLCVSELELIEPELWFREYPAAADRLAEAVKRYL